MKELPIDEQLDFSFLLELMVMLEDEPLYSILPELFSILGHEKLILLCKFVGGEVVKVPTIKELTTAIEAMQYFTDIDIKQIKSEISNPDAIAEASKIRELIC